jgi:hypothetical protein
VVGWERRYIGHEVEATTPVLGKLWALKRAREASGAIGYRAVTPDTEEGGGSIMSEEIRGLVAKDETTVTNTLGHEAPDIAHTEGRSFLGNGYRLDLVSVPGATVLLREDGSEVARFSVWDATSQAIEQAAREDRRTI